MHTLAESHIGQRRELRHATPQRIPRRWVIRLCRLTVWLRFLILSPRSTPRALFAFALDRMVSRILQALVAVLVLCPSAATESSRAAQLGIMNPTPHSPRPYTEAVAAALNEVDSNPALRLMFEHLISRALQLNQELERIFPQPDEALWSRFVVAAELSAQIYHADYGKASLEAIISLPPCTLELTLEGLTDPACSVFNRALHGWRLAGSRVLPLRQELTMAWYVNKDLRHVYVVFQGSSKRWHFVQDAVLAVTQQGLLSVDAAVHMLSDPSFPVQYYVRRGFTVSFAGHSLGALLAEQCACVFGTWAATFDSPGSGGDHYLHPECLRNMNRSAMTPAQRPDLDEFGQPLPPHNCTAHNTCPSPQWRARWSNSRPLNESEPASDLWDPKSYIFNFLSYRLNLIHVLHEQWGNEVLVAFPEPSIPEGLPIFLLGALFAWRGLLSTRLSVMMRRILMYSYSALFLLSPACTPFLEFYRDVSTISSVILGVPDPWFWLCLASLGGCLALAFLWPMADPPEPPAIAHVACRRRQASMAMWVWHVLVRFVFRIDVLLALACLGLYGQFWLIPQHASAQFARSMADHNWIKYTMFPAGSAQRSYTGANTVHTVLFALFWYFSFGVAATLHIEAYFKAYPIPGGKYAVQACNSACTLGAACLSIFLLEDYAPIRSSSEAKGAMILYICVMLLVYCAYCAQQVNQGGLGPMLARPWTWGVPLVAMFFPHRNRLAADLARYLVATSK